MSTIHRPRPAAVAAALTLSAACALGAATSASARPRPPANAVTVTTNGMDYIVHGHLHPGTATLRWRNRDDEAHMMAFSRLKPGVTLRRLMAAQRKGERATVALLADGPDATYGSPATLGAHQSTTVTMANLARGDYAMICFLVAKNGMPHWQMGMVNILHVKGAARRGAPHAVATIRITDRAIVLPPAIRRGQGTFRVVNQGTKHHSLQLVRLAKGTTLAAYNRWFGGQSQAGKPVDGGGGVLAGGIDDLAGGHSGWLTLHLAHGRYGYASTDDITGPGLPPQSGVFTVR